MLNELNLAISFCLNNKLSRIFFAIATGLALALSSAAFGCGFYAWFGLIPLLLLSKSSNSFKTTIFESLCFLLSYNLTSFFWLQGLHPLTWQGFSQLESLIITNSAWLIASFYHSLLTLPFILILKLFYQHRADQRSHELKILDMFLLTFMWLVCHYKLLIHFNIFAVPINFLAYSQYHNLALIQVSNLVGAVGLEGFIVLVNLAISNLFNVQMTEHNLVYHLRSQDTKFNIKKPFFGINGPLGQLSIFCILVLTLIFIYGYGFLEIKSSSEFELQNFNTKKSFAIVQADYSAASSRSVDGNYDHLLLLQNQLSSKLVDKQDLLLWSEGAVPSVNKPKELELLANYTDEFVFGTYSSSGGQHYNSIEFRDFVNENQIYNKRLLVPFGEYTPFYGLLPESLKNLANTTVGQGFTQATNDQPLINTKAGIIAASLCFELLFPDLIRSTVAKGADLMINLNDLSWFKGNQITRDWVKRQFLAVAVFRAVENKRDLLLVSNSGYSALINSYGKIKYISEANKIALIQGHYSLHQDFSKYSLYGW